MNENNRENENSHPITMTQAATKPVRQNSIFSANPGGGKARLYTRTDLDSFVKRTFVHEAELDGSRTEAELIRYFEENLFFITVTFRSAARANVDLCSSEFRKFYFYFCRLMVGGHFQRKQALQPLTFFCVDDEGSRHGNVNLSSTANAHVHALALARPEVSRNWKPEMKGKLLNKVFGTADIHIEKFNSQKSSLENLISYTTKGLRRFQNDGIFYDFLPGWFEARQQSRSTWNQRWKTTKPVEVLGKAGTDRFRDFI